VVVVVVVGWWGGGLWQFRRSEDRMMMGSIYTAHWNDVFPGAGCQVQRTIGVGGQRELQPHTLFPLWCTVLSAVGMLLGR
jgi:hypothetical protein